ncbi:C2HC5 finger protein [Magnaporthiopsis poae ATCC 64411]|uniref:C2HC5 finger protein n=1 Tax=Magnaporthiopsis poae (strain ATCC 64411 / 73-15) TaxID=644358 RepID=A0A0C4DP06_MAGP6|nr:C2HC5 finger protein [Magnaporthiopsis poae ATCC 64411]
MSLIQLSRLIDLPEPDLQQVLDYASTLSKPEAAEHFGNLLGDSPQAVEFISAFNGRRKDPTVPAASQPQTTARPSEIDAVPKPQRGQKKKKAALHTPAPRQITNTGPGPGTSYSKKDFEEDYISSRSGASSPAQRPGSAKPPSKASAVAPPPKPPPSASGSLVSDLLAVPKRKSKSNSSSRSSTPAPQPKNHNAATKVVITGGTPMHGASTAISDLDAAIRALEITTNPTLSGDGDNAARRCNCVAARHPLQTAAPNCLSCGKVVCLKEGLGPCTFCGASLLSPAEVQAMIKELKLERGKERMAEDRRANKRADLKKQQKLLREMEWNARPEYEKRTQVLSIDLAGGKVVKKMVAAERPPSPDDTPAEPDYAAAASSGVLGELDGNRVAGGGAFSRNPLLKGLIKPVYDAKGKGAELEGRKDKATRWRRVQDDLDDNEGVILDGGIYGGSPQVPDTSREEPA